MTARLSIDIGNGSGVVVIPIEAVRDAAVAPNVLIRRPDGEVVRHKVSIGRTNAAGVQILDGLAAGDAVIIPE
jgi:HlyD family secretion protein